MWGTKTQHVHEFWIFDPRKTIFMDWFDRIRSLHLIQYWLFLARYLNIEWDDSNALLWGTQCRCVKIQNIHDVYYVLRALPPAPDHSSMLEDSCFFVSWEQMLLFLVPKPVIWQAWCLHWHLGGPSDDSGPLGFTRKDTLESRLWFSIDLWWTSGRCFESFSGTSVGKR